MLTTGVRCQCTCRELEFLTIEHLVVIEVEG